MGIEPTWDFVEPHLGFEDQERHQVALRLLTVSLYPSNKHLGTVTSAGAILLLARDFEHIN